MTKLKMLRIVVLSFFTISFLVYSGCGSDPVFPPITKVTVNGKAVDINGNGIANVIVSIEGSNSVTAADGSFTFTEITTPYNVKLLQTTAVNSAGFEYQGLTSTSPYLFISGAGTAQNSAVLTVNIPALGLNQRALVAFTDTISTEFASTISLPSSSTSLNVQWAGASTISGKVIVLVYNISGSTIVSYEKYGVMSGFALNNGGTASTTFDPSDLSTNPVEANVSGTVTAPSGYTVSGSTLGFTFKTGGSTIFTLPVTGNSSANFSYTVPASLSSYFKIIVNGTADGTSPVSTSKFAEVAPGSSGTSIALDEAVTLITPIDAATGIDTSSTFVSGQGAGNGIFFVSFSSSGKSFYVFTNLGITKMPSFSSNGLGIGSNVSYTWKITKIGNLNSMDTFVSSSVSNNPNITSSSESLQRTFTTAP